MNHDQHITDQITEIKQDKSIIQPWRNKAIARLEEAQAFIRMGKTAAPTRKGDPYQLDRGPLSQESCICIEGRPYKASCPVHGL